MEKTVLSKIVFAGKNTFCHILFFNFKFNIIFNNVHLVCLVQKLIKTKDFKNCNYNTININIF